MKAACCPQRQGRHYSQQTRNPTQLSWQCFTFGCYFPHTDCTTHCTIILLGELCSDQLPWSLARCSSGLGSVSSSLQLSRVVTSQPIKLVIISSECSGIVSIVSISFLLHIFFVISLLSFMGDPIQWHVVSCQRPCPSAVFCLSLFMENMSEACFSKVTCTK